MILKMNCIHDWNNSFVNEKHKRIIFCMNCGKKYRRLFNVL